MGDLNEADGKATPAGAVSTGIILIVDDEETSVTALEVACSAIPDMEVSLFQSAVEAVRCLRDGNPAVRAVITDIGMPRMDGFELIAFLRADPRYARVPIVVVSADADPATPERGFGLGANAYFSKPYSPSEVRRKLEQLLDANRILQ
jgi:CheY-like chemotaxis protein